MLPRTPLRPLCRALAAALGALALAAPAARAQSAAYTFTQLNPTDQDGNPAGRSQAYGVNNAGQVAGTYQDAFNFEYGFVYSGGAYATISDESSFFPQTRVHGINNLGQLVGVNYVGNGNHSFVYTAGTFTNFTVPDASETTARGINDAGLVVGYYGSAGSPDQGFLYDSRTGAYSTISVPGADVTRAFGINNLGQVVGSYDDATGAHAFTYNATTSLFGTFDVPGSYYYTDAYGVNDLGQIVGAYEDQDGNDHGFLYAGGAFTTLDYPGSTDVYGYSRTYAYGINNAGRIAGYYVDGYDDNYDDVQRGFVADPAGAAVTTPEPATYALLVPGLLALGAVAGRRSRRQRSLQ